jgi:type II secretory pathway pseudopilin PulG
MIELLVAMAVAGVTLGAAVQFYATHARTARAHAFRIEAQQALRASLDAITRDLRLAGACLPVDGEFVALDGVDGPGGDSLTIRSGVVGDDMSCIRTALSAPADAGANTVQVDATDGFAAGMLAYVRHLNGSGEILPLTGVGANALTFGAGLSQDYLLGAVYALDERTYDLDLGDPDLPVLTLTINRGAPSGFAAGVRDLQVSYVLAQGCPPCARVDLPADTAEWWLVNAVELTAMVGTVGGVRPEDEAVVVATAAAKPRNLLP